MDSSFSQKHSQLGCFPCRRHSSINAEAVIAGNPDAIFIGASSWVNRPKAVRTGYGVSAEETRRSLAPYAERPGWPDTAARCFPGSPVVMAAMRARRCI